MDLVVDCYLLIVVSSYLSLCYYHLKSFLWKSVIFYWQQVTFEVLRVLKLCLRFCQPTFVHASIHGEKCKHGSGVYVFPLMKLYHCFNLSSKFPFCPCFFFLLLLLYSPQFEVLLPNEAHGRTLRHTWCIWIQLLAFM